MNTLPAILQRGVELGNDDGSNDEARSSERSLAIHATGLAEGLIKQSPFDSDADFIHLDLASRPGQNPYDPYRDSASAFLRYRPKNPHGIHDVYALARHKNTEGLYTYTFGMKLGTSSLSGICWTSDSEEIGKVTGIVNQEPRITQPRVDEVLYYLDLLERAICYDRDTHAIILTLSGKNKIVKRTLLASLTHTAGKLINGY
jgi:hypothetical protein